MGWNKKRLINITDKIGSGATPRGGKNSYKESGISLFRSLNVYDGVFKKKNLAFIDEEQAGKLSNVVVQKGDVLLNITGASVARCCVAPSMLLPARVNQHVAIIRPKPSHLDTDFLAHLLASPQYKEALLESGEKAGATRQALTKAQLENFEICIPSVSEQKQIVAILDEVFVGIDDAIANTEKNLTNARELFENYLNAIFTQEGNGWQKKTLDELCLKITDGVHHTPKYTATGVPFLSVKNLTQGFIDFSNTKFVSPEAHAVLIRRCKPDIEDVLYTKVGTTGVAKVIDVDREFSLFVSVALLKIDHTVIFNQFLEHFLNSKVGRDQAKKRTRGMANKNLVIRDIRQITILYPKSKKQQKEIVNKIGALKVQTQRLEAIYQQKLAALNELKQSILQKAFTGELTADTATEATQAIKEEIAA